LRVLVIDPPLYHSTCTIRAKGLPVHKECSARGHRGFVSTESGLSLHGRRDALHGHACTPTMRFVIDRNKCSLHAIAHRSRPAASSVTWGATPPSATECRLSHANRAQRSFRTGLIASLPPLKHIDFLICVKTGDFVFDLRYTLLASVFLITICKGFEQI
jgi:hypothetical protein